MGHFNDPPWFLPGSTKVHPLGNRRNSFSERSQNFIYDAIKFLRLHKQVKSYYGGQKIL